MAHTQARAIRAAKRAYLDLPLPGDDYAAAELDAPDDEPMQLLDGEPVDLREAWVMPGEKEYAK